MTRSKQTELTSIGLLLFVVLYLGLVTDVLAAPFAYVGHLSNSGQAGLVSVIDTASNINIGTIPVGLTPAGVAVHLAGTRVYVSNYADSTLSVIDTATKTVVATECDWGHVRTLLPALSRVLPPAWPHALTGLGYTSHI